MLKPSGPNAEQIQYWNELAGAKWVALQPLLDAQLAPLGHAVMDRIGISPGEAVVDVGCGCGNSTLELGRRVGPTGTVTGIDISGVMLERGREAVREAGLQHVRFENADAQTHPLPAETFDLLYSRFGVMFFTDPVAAFANLRDALRRGGRVGFICWQALDRNAWMAIPLRAALAHIPPPPVPPPGAPGPFAFADSARVERILSSAGFADVQIESLTGALDLAGGTGLDHTVEFMLETGPLGRALREVSEETRQRVAESVRAAVLPFLTAQGVQMPYAAWSVTAERP